MKKMFSFRLDVELIELLKVEAEKLNRSTSNLIETILWDWVRKQN